ncbi:hypothetical protein CLOM_g9042 [Closterium sp. NIES-68]|nr:hypothetical protein CLOM_g9042 [Closterium sp. NIES-68]
MKQHVEHRRDVFEILRRERFYVKLSKSEFALEKVQFLGHMVSAQGVHVDPKKIEAVRTWKTPENVKELQQFLGFANYYNRFVPQYAKLAAPLTNLLKKNTPYKWEPKHQEAVEQLKQALTSAPVLILPDPERDYVIEADASTRQRQKFVTSCDTCQRMKSSKQKKADYCSLFLSQNNHGKWLAWTSSPGYHLPPAVMTQSLSSSTSSPKWDTSSRHTRRHAPRRQHNSSFVHHLTAWHSNHTHLRPRPQVQQVLEGTYVSPRDQTRHVIRLPSADRRTDRAPQPIVEQLLRAACKDEISKWDLHLPVLEFAYNNATHALLDRRRSSSATDATHSHHKKPTTSATVTPVTFRLRLPATWKIHNAFHVQLLKPYRDPNTIFVGRQRRRRRPSSSRMNPSTRSSPCLHTAVVGMAPWSFLFVGRVMILLRTAG